MMEAGVSARLAAASRGWRPWALLLTLCLALYLPGIGAMPPLDRDEARFMQASRQMLESGDLLRIRFQDEARNKKPAGIYWLQAASVALVSAPASTAAWPYRLPSLLGATAAVLFVFGFGARLVGRPAALIAAALLAASVLLVAEAHLAKTDAVLLAATAAAQGALGAVYAREREEKPAGPGAAFLFWIAEGLGILITGPVLPLVSLLTVLGLGIADRRWRWLAGLRPAWGVPLALALVLPWFIAIEAATGGAFAGEAVGHDFLGKLVGAQESHGAPPLTYLLLLPVTFWPGSALLTVGATAAWRHRGETALRFLLAWLVPSWIVFELVPTKLPHYVLPLYPALALLIGSALLRRAAASPGRSQRLPDALAFALWALVGAALILALIGLPIALGGRVEAWSLVPAAAILGCAFLLLRRFGSGFGIAAAPLLAATGFLVFAPAYAAILPGLRGFWLSRSAAELVWKHPPPRGSSMIETVGYNEPSLVFLLGGKTRSADAGQAAQDLAAEPGALALVAGGEEARFRAALGARGMQAVKLGEASGVDYSRSSRPMTIALYAARAG